MHQMKRLIAATELMLISPAVLFMTALFVRGLQPLQEEPAHTADRIAMWYAGRQWTLWVFLVALPLAALITGCATLRRKRNNDATMLFIAAMTLTAGAVLARVAVHMLSR